MKRKIIEIDEALCNGCGQCVTACAEGAIQLVDGKAKLVSDQYCDGLGDCIGYCPTGALKIIKREAKDFDEALAAKSHQTQSICHCPYSQSRTFKQSGSALNHWPIQISLVSETADFLKQADLLIAADCTAFVDPTFSKKIKNKMLLIGCPKLDNAEFYVDKLSKIFKDNNINSITIIRMSVPCCQGMTMIVQQALQQAEKNIPLCEEIVEVG